jgi:hypothetical protein
MSLQNEIDKQQATLTSLVPKTIRDAIKQTNGNLVAAADKLGVAVSRLDRVIRLAPQIYRFAGELKNIKGYAEYSRVSIERIEEDIARRAILYRSEALDSIRDIATMPLSDNSAQNQVKLLAAVRLYNETNDPQMGTEIDQTLRALNADYQRTAPRIKKIRETVREISYEEERPAIDVTPD